MGKQNRALPANFRLNTRLDGDLRDKHKHAKGHLEKRQAPDSYISE